MTAVDSGAVQWAMIALWLGWLGSWMAAAPWSAKTVKGAGIVARLRDTLLIVPGVIALWGRLTFAPSLSQRLYALAPGSGWALVACIAIGIAFAWWARIHLGRLWSGSVTVKEGHRVVDSGPYRLVRHPIYTGLLLAIYATAALRANGFAFIGAALITLGVYWKARLEERLLTGELGPDYEGYRARVPMLVPFFRP
jgi:protein-S-isoprenylcysteine O-methyltransferase Ste14